jgi:signal transduction histidine kinase
MALTLALNIALLVALTVVHQWVVRRWREWTVVRLVVSGLLFGSIAVLGMLTPFRPAPGIQYDGRSIILAVAGVFGGPVVAAVAATIAAAFRLTLGGSGAWAGVAVCAEAAGLGVAYHYLRRKRPQIMRWLPLYGLAVLVHVGLLAIQLALLPAAVAWSIVSEIWVPVLVFYPVGMLLVCRLMIDQEQRLEDEEALRAVNESLERIVDERTRELEAANERLTRANSELEHATRAKSEFLASMSHELRTPLNAIIGFAGTLGQGLTGPLTSEQTRQVAIIGSAGRHLLELVNQVLDLAKIEQGASPLQVGEFDLAELAAEVCDTLRPLAESKGLILQVTVPDDMLALRSDATKLEQILTNLTGNAIKFTDRGRVDVEVRRDGDRVVITVTDSGPGIPTDEIPHVFEEFYQLEARGQAKNQGTGLGLAIVRRLTDQLGGWLNVSSELGVGSSFELELPVELKTA